MKVCICEVFKNTIQSLTRKSKCIKGHFTLDFGQLMKTVCKILR